MKSFAKILCVVLVAINALFAWFLIGFGALNLAYVHSGLACFMLAAALFIDGGEEEQSDHED